MCWDGIEGIVPLGCQGACAVEVSGGAHPRFCCSVGTGLTSDVLVACVVVLYQVLCMLLAVGSADAIWRAALYHTAVCCRWLVASMAMRQLLKWAVQFVQCTAVPAVWLVSL